MGWNVNGVSVMSPCAWLRLHNHGWEYAETFFKLCFKQVQDLAFKSYGKDARRTQIDYLTEYKLTPKPNRIILSSKWTRRWAAFSPIHAESKLYGTHLMRYSISQNQALKTSPAKENMTRRVAKVPVPKRIIVSLAAMAAKLNVATAVVIIGKPTASKILTDPIIGPANQPRGPQTPNSTLGMATAIRSVEEAR